MQFMELSSSKTKGLSSKQLIHILGHPGLRRFTRSVTSIGKDADDIPEVKGKG